MTVIFNRRIKDSNEPVYLSAATFLTRRGYFPLPEAIAALERYADKEAEDEGLEVKTMGGQPSPINKTKNIPVQKIYLESVLIAVLIDLKSSGILEKI